MEPYLLKISVICAFIFLHSLPYFFILLLLFLFFRAFFVALLSDCNQIKKSGMLQKTLGIVLHTLKYKDTSLIADIYTEVAGRASFMVSWENDSLNQEICCTQFQLSL